MTQTELDTLAHEFINCGDYGRDTHPMRLVYEFMLGACDNPAEARAEFARYLAGEFSERILELARKHVGTEQNCDSTALRSARRASGKLGNRYLIEAEARAVDMAEA